MPAKPTDSTYSKERSPSGRRHTAVKVAGGGSALAAALILSYVEAVLPLNIGIPGIKPGFANIAVLFLLYNQGFGAAITVSVLRVVLSGILFGNFTSFVYAMSGALFSLAVMAALKKTNRFSPVGVSAAGGISHNLAQITAAAVILDTAQVMYYLPALTAGGVICGALVGILGSAIINKLRIK